MSHVEQDDNSQVDGMSEVGAVGTATDQVVSQERLRGDAEILELFLLRPRIYSGRELTVRLRINGRLFGWKLKDGLLKSLNLELGDTIGAECTLKYEAGYFSDIDDIDLFADGTAADALIDIIRKAGRVSGCVIDCVVETVYHEAPIGPEGQVMSKASIVLKRILRYVGVEDDFDVTCAFTEQDVQQP